MTTTLSNLPVTSKVLAKQDVDLADLVRALQADALAKSPEPQKVTLPKKVTPTEMQRTRVEDLLVTLDELKFPVVRRKLSAAEKANVLRWTQEIKDIVKLLDTVIDQLKATFFNHADCVAEEDGRAVPGETPRDKHGWYLLPDKDVAGVLPTEPMKLVREYRAGQVGMEVDSVDELIDDKVLSAADRKRVVKTVEVVDEDGLMKLLAERPHLIPTVVAKAKQVSTPSVAFQVRQNK